MEWPTSRRSRVARSQAKMDGDKLVVIDEKGGGAVVETADVYQSNGVAHVIDSVLMPK